MLAKLRKHIKGMLGGKINLAGEFDDGTYIMISDRIVHLENGAIDITEPPLQPLDERTKKTLIATNIGDWDYTAHEIPDCEEIRTVLTNLIGNRGKKIVLYCDDTINVNAKYLYQALIAFRAKKCFVKKGAPGILIFDKDNVESEEWEYILQYKKNNDKKGYVVLENNA